jgi:hypothetical protein
VLGDVEVGKLVAIHADPPQRHPERIGVYRLEDPFTERGRVVDARVVAARAASGEGSRRVDHARRPAVVLPAEREAVRGLDIPGRDERRNDAAPSAGTKEALHLLDEPRVGRRAEVLERMMAGDAIDAAVGQWNALRARFQTGDSRADLSPQPGRNADVVQVPVRSREPRQVRVDPACHVEERVFGTGTEHGEAGEELHELLVPPRAEPRAPLGNILVDPLLHRAPADVEHVDREPAAVADHVVRRRRHHPVDHGIER